MSDQPDLHTVVCVEDNPDNLQLVEWVLETTGRYRVVGATNGVSGFEAVRQHRPDLVLLDLDLPLLNGLELARRLRADPELRHIPLVAISASIMRQERQRSLAAGCMAFIEKPFDVAALREVVADCIRRARADAPAE